MPQVPDQQLIESARHSLAARKPAEALERLIEFLQRRPGHAEALHMQGICLAQLNRKPEAESAFRAALDFRPDYAPALNNLGVMLVGSNRAAEAVGVFARAAAGRPDDYVTLLNYANALSAAHQFEQAAAVYRKCLVVNPNIPEALTNLAQALRKIGRFDEAVGYYNQAANIQPNNMDALDNFGSILREVGRLDEAMNCYRRVISIKPDHSSAHWNMSLVLLMRGQLDEGWRQYEWRLGMKDSGFARTVERHPVLAGPRWDGFDLRGKRIHIYAEQGYGDVIHYARYLPLLARQGAHVSLACHKALVPLMRTVEGVEIVQDLDQSPPPFDTHLPQMSLPLQFNTTLQSIPADVPYVRADAAKVEYWRSKLAGDQRRKIGLAWIGKQQPDPRRSMPLAALAPLAGIANVHWISLQVGEGSQHARTPPAGMQITDWTSEIADFSDTAALMENLDSVISIDSAVAHLAGALAKKTYLLLPRAANWRWMLERTDSPWYPTMRLFRQETAGDWSGPVRQIAQNLG